MILKKTLLSASIVIALAACGGSSNDSTPTPTPTPNVAPKDISISANVVAENATGASIGELSATDDNTSDTFTFSTTDDRFIISGNTLSLADNTSFDYESEQTVTVNITVTDNGGLTYSEGLEINIEDVLDRYEFASKFSESESSVKYTGQIARHILISELNHYISEQLQSDLNNDVFTTKQEVLDKLNTFYRTDKEFGWDNFEIKSFGERPDSQKFMDQISTAKQLHEKIAGMDPKGQEINWDTEFSGWQAKGSLKPYELVDILFEQLANNAEEQILSGNHIRISDTGHEISKVYINKDGTDLKQLIQKYLLMAIPYSQATGDYLGDDHAEKGLNQTNIEESNLYTALEHQFDEGFGYFGAAINYLELSDEEIKANTGSDLLVDYNFGQSVNAAKRDLGTKDNSSPTDFTKQTMEAFLTGRKIINDNAGSELTTEQMTSLVEQTRIAIDGWERAIASTVIHYINDTRSDLELLENEDAAFSYSDLAKHYSEMKAFALGLQFNPYSKVSDDDFETLHALMRNAPELDKASISSYRSDLLEARKILQDAFGFNEENVENW